MPAVARRAPAPLYRALVKARVVAAVLLLCGATAAEPAFAGPPDRATTEVRAEAETLANAAKERFRDKDFPRAAKLFMQAYALTHEPALVYNAARAYEEAGMAGEAMGLFRLYISLTEDADGILEARERMKRLEAGGSARTKAPVAPETPAPPAPDRADAAPAAPSAAPAQTLPPTAPVAPVRPTGKAPAEATPATTIARGGAPQTARHVDTWARWSVAGGAVASLGTGAALMLVGSAGTREANRDLANDARAYNAAYDTAQTQWWSGAGLTGLGVGLAGVATWLWLADGDAAVALTPTVGGLCVAGRF